MNNGRANEIRKSPHRTASCPLNVVSSPLKDRSVVPTDSSVLHILVRAVCCCVKKGELPVNMSFEQRLSQLVLVLFPGKEQVLLIVPTMLSRKFVQLG